MIENSRIFELWQEYTTRGSCKTVGDLRTDILSSWDRSREYGIDTEKSILTEVADTELQNRLDQAEEMIFSALPNLHKLFRIIEDDESVITMSDADGVILEVLSSELMRGMPNFPVKGSVHNERVAGTNGIGTSLACNKALQMTGAEHWQAINHNWVCSSTPLRVNNMIIGCINLSCPMLGKHHEHTLGLVVATANSIEREIMLNKVLKEKQTALLQQNTILELVETGIIALDRSGTITQINQQALDAFKVRGVWENRSIDELISTGIDFKKIMNEGIVLEDHEVSVEAGGAYRPLSFSTHNIKNMDQTGIGMVIQVRTAGTLRRLVNRASGAHAHFTFDDIICQSESMEQPVRIGRLAGQNHSNVLILGDSGTGKELFAQSIHSESDRKNKPFVAVNCGAFSRELIQSELFGYEGGAFTGAKRGGNPGKFELADGGTLFLDEIGELPLEHQVNLLRVLQTGEVHRIGAKHPIRVDVRIIAATNQNLHQLVKEKSFRGDLFYRLDVLSIHLPPLSKRKGDIRLLIDYFGKRIAEQQSLKSVKISDSIYRLFENYSWPGNIRELENVLHRAIILSEDGRICEDVIAPHLLDEMKGQGQLPQKGTSPAEESSSFDRQEAELKNLLKALTETSGNIRKTAALLGISRGTIYNMMKRYNLDLKDYR